MTRLVALDMPASAAFVETVQRVWDRGDAVLPIDQRLPLVAKQTLIEAMAPFEIVDFDLSTTQLTNSRSLEPDDALVIVTSGSTGLPKGVIHTHVSLQAGAKASTARLSLTSFDHWLVCIPVSHVGGFSVITRAVYSGATLTAQPSFDPAAVMHAAHKGATHTSLVATALSRVNASAFKTILLGGSTAPPNLPDNVVATYGMTETGGGVVYNGQPLDGVEIKIVEDEIFLRCAMLMRGYRDGSDFLTCDGWYATGDMGSIDETGTLQISGRRSDMIITGGENVWPSIVEKSLLTHPLVSQVVVRGAQDESWGQRVVAYVVLDDAIDAPVADKLRDLLRDHVKQTLPLYCAPQQIVVLAFIPRTSLGKVDIQALVSCG